MKTLAWWSFRATISVAAFVVVALVVLRLDGTRTGRLAGEAWAELDAAGLASERAPTRANDAALRVERAASQLGIDLAPRTSGRADGDCVRRLEVPHGCSAEIEARLRGAASTGRLETWADATRAETDALVAALLDGPEPRWERAWTPAGGATESSTLIEGIRAGKLLLARAIVEADRGRPEPARRALEAFRRLDAAQAVEPTAVGVLVTANHQRRLAIAARRLPHAERDWVDHLAPDLEPVFAAAHARAWAENAHWVADDARFGDHVRDFGFAPLRWWARATRPVLARDVARASRAEAATLAALRAMDACSVNPHEVALAQ